MTRLFVSWVRLNRCACRGRAPVIHTLEPAAVFAGIPPCEQGQR
ncbi:hypothetical protein [Salinactinospora qingdaonensis]